MVPLINTNQHNNVEGTMQRLDHERLEVYQVARELSREINRVIKRARYKRERRDLVDQVLRATASVPLNICEGTGERSEGRKAYFYRIARASATELAGALDHMVDMDMLSESDLAAAKPLIVRVVSMLFKLTNSVTTPESYPPLPRRPAARQTGRKIQSAPAVDPP
jgi:four helix bundle protein